MRVNKPQILIVEDEGLVAWELQEALTHMGYRVPHVVSSGKDALDSVVADCPDLIIKEICPIPVIYLTADCNEATLQKAKDTEAYGYILKPFEERALRASLEIALSRGRRDLEKKEEHEWNEIILKNLEDGVIAANPKGAVTRCNAKALAMLERGEGEVLGKPFASLVRISDERTLVPETLSVVKTIIDNEASGKSGCRLAVREGKSIPIEYRLAPLKNKNNNTIGAIIFLKPRPASV
jgi:DNA-binding response OmpR family regulator